MNATMVASGTKAVPPVGSSIQDVPLGKIRESKTCKGDVAWYLFFLPNADAGQPGTRPYMSGLATNR
jgi:hypothetical protein